MTRSLKNKTTDLSLDGDADDVNQEISIAELNFSDDDPAPSFKDLTPETEEDLVENAASTTSHSRAARLLGSEVSEDDMAPEILIKEDGALSPQETGSDTPADQTLRVVDADKIGAGTGRDETELAESDPLDKQAPVKGAYNKT